MNTLSCRYIKITGMVFLTLLSWGCSNSEEEDVNAWMVQQRNSLKPMVVQVSEPKSFNPASYGGGNSVDPFNNQKLLGGLRAEAPIPEAGSALLVPELNRRKEPLEAFPLDAMVMGGTLQKGGQRVALVRVDRLLYQIGVGAYLGQNYGKVVAIAENSVTLREIVQDGAGEWMERPATLELQESAK